MTIKPVFCDSVCAMKNIIITSGIRSLPNAIDLQRIANRTARTAYGTVRATNVIFGDVPEPTVTHYDPYHAESRTGIRAKMIALKRFWSTYHYVPTRCTVTLPRSMHPAPLYAQA